MKKWTPGVRIGSAAGFALLLAACGGGAEGSGEWAGTVEDSAGVEIVRNTLQPMQGGEVWTFEDVLTFGEAAGDPNYQFGQIAGLDVSSDGRILVLDQQAGHIKVFSPEGTFERTIGQPGSGPGELGPQAALLMVGRGDTVLVPDAGNQRVNVYFLDDSEPLSFPIRMEEGIPMRWEMSDQGTLVAQRRSLNLPNQEVQEDEDLIARQAYDGAITDTLLTPPRGETFSFSSGLPEFHFFVPEPAWTLLSDGSLAFAMSDVYRISVYGLDGTLNRVITVPIERKPVGEEDIEIIEEMLGKVFEQQGVPPQFVDQIMQNVSFEDHFPAFTQMRSGPENELWIQRAGVPSEMTAEERENWNPMLDPGVTDEWDVFDAEGRLVGMVRIPDRFTPFSLKGDRLYGVWRDDLEVQYVRVYQLVRPTG